MTSAAPAHDALLPSYARLQIEQDLRPDPPRRSTDPASTSPLQASLAIRPRTRSPFSRGHHRSQSAQGLSAPPMARTKSLPTVTLSPFPTAPSSSPARPSSPLRPPSASRASPRKSFEETRPLSAGTAFTEIESIAEDSEVDFTPRSMSHPRDFPLSPPPAASNSVSFQRSNSGRRRPTSPLFQQQYTLSEPSMASSPSPGSSARFNEPFPTAPSTASYTYSAGSSIPSTPTSFRSRSPSISSLDTIEDSPDAEEEAAEAHHLARLKAAADAAEAAGVEAETERKLRAAGLEAPAVSPAVSATWSPQSLKEKRKRWSVCGAERRADFEMETIWED